MNSYRKIGMSLVTLMSVMTLTGEETCTNTCEAQAVDEKARLNHELSEKAATLYGRGYNVLSKAMGSSDVATLYTGDKNYLGAFPFDTYQLHTVENQGQFFIDPINDWIKNCLRYYGAWEPMIAEEIKRHVKAGTVVLDIGSHIGTHTITMSNCVGPEGKVFAFDPNKKIFRELCYNMAQNAKYPNIYPIRCALGLKRGVISPVVSRPENEGGTYITYDHKGDSAAALLRLDDFHFENVSFMKIDVENMEAEVLAGALATIKNNSPVILIEIQGNVDRAEQLSENTDAMKQETLDRLISLGYRVEKLPSRDDYLAFPPGR